jgi:hypothetical protein
MLEEKRGSTFRAISALIGTVFLFIALYFLNQENFLYGGILGIIGILFITISIFPYMKFTST